MLPLFCRQTEELQELTLDFILMRLNLDPFLPSLAPNSKGRCPFTLPLLHFLFPYSYSLLTTGNQPSHYSTTPSCFLS
ncbi:Uncharacterized protein HZ326_26361 [Fusarium oxysporum f. sp. albedinis]|nr:Uncharacterized protein HZ326_26361 [Fusarium oxysporum f. sp. albedinis]